MKKLYHLSAAEQKELLEVTKHMSVVINKEGKGAARGDPTKVRKLWRKWAKEKQFKIKSIEPHNEHEAAFWATPTTSKKGRRK